MLLGHCQIWHNIGTGFEVATWSVQGLNHVFVTDMLVHLALLASTALIGYHEIFRRQGSDQ